MANVDKIALKYIPMAAQPINLTCVLLESVQNTLRNVLILDVN